jgi:hypothetical protein
MDTKPWYQSKTIIAGIGTFLTILVMVLKFIFNVDISDQIPVLTNGLLAFLALVGSVVMIYGRLTAKTVISSDPPMPRIRGPLMPLIAALMIPAVLFSSCAPGPVNANSPAAVLGTHLATDAAQAVQAFVEFQGGNTDMAWALSKGFIAYQDFIAGAADIKAIVKAWTGNVPGSQTLADRLARIFGSAPGSPAEKTAALQVVVASVAADRGV